MNVTQQPSWYDRVSRCCTLSNLARSAVLVAILACALQYLEIIHLQRDNVREIRAELLQVEDEYLAQRSRNISVAIGFGACVDIFMNASDFWSSLGWKRKLRENGDFDVISTADELQQMFSYYFSRGAAAERYVADKELFEKMVLASDRTKVKTAVVGGNAPVMARRFAMEGSDVTLAARLTKKWQETMHENIALAGGTVEADDLHLMLEYQNGEKIGGIKATRANRFIAHSDVNNAQLTTLAAMEDKLAERQYDVLLVSGLQMMDNFKFGEGEMEEILGRLERVCRSVEGRTRRHFELASFTDVNLMVALNKFVLPVVDSLGLNEQELANLHSMLTSGTITHDADAYLNLADASDMVRDILQLVPTLTRIHLHNVVYQLIGQRPGSWPSPRAAVARASLVATRHTCGEHTPPVSRLNTRWEKPSAVECWTEAGLEWCAAAVLICQKVVKTAGGGDNITPVGLVTHLLS